MRVRPEWDEELAATRARVPRRDRSSRDTVEPGEPFEAELYGTPHPSRLVPGPWQEALSEFAGEPLTLLWSEGGARDRGNDRGGWASIVSRGSLERLGEEAGAAEPVDGRRFRMLFEIDGVEPHEEDTWLGKQVAIGDAVIVPLGDVGRCVVTTCDPDTGVSDFDTLKRPRRLPPGGRGRAVAVRRLLRRRRAGTRARRRRSAAGAARCADIAELLLLAYGGTDAREAKGPVERLHERIVAGDRGWFFAQIADRVAESARRRVSPSASSPSSAGRRSRRSPGSSAAAGRRGSTRCSASPRRCDCELVVELEPRK